MEAAATEGRHLTRRPRKKASAQLRRWSSRGHPASPSLRSSSTRAHQPDVTSCPVGLSMLAPQVKQASFLTRRAPHVITPGRQRRGSWPEEGSWHREKLTGATLRETQPTQGREASADSGKSGHLGQGTVTRGRGTVSYDTWPDHRSRMGTGSGVAGSPKLLVTQAWGLQMWL